MTTHVPSRTAKTQTEQYLDQKYYHKLILKSICKLEFPVDSESEVRSGVAHLNHELETEIVK